MVQEVEGLWAAGVAISFAASEAKEGAATAGAALTGGVAAVAAGSGFGARAGAAGATVGALLGTAAGVTGAETGVLTAPGRSVELGGGADGLVGAEGTGVSVLIAAIFKFFLFKFLPVFDFIFLFVTLITSSRRHDTKDSRQVKLRFESYS